MKYTVSIGVISMIDDGTPMEVTNMNITRVRRLLPQTIAGCTLVAATMLLFPASAMASLHTAHAPNGAGKTTYDTSNNHYTIYDEKGDHRAVAVIFERKDGTDVGFQSCHEGAGSDCPGDLPSSVRGELYMSMGVGLGPDKSRYTFGPRVRISNA